MPVEARGVEHFGRVSSVIGHMRQMLVLASLLTSCGFT